VLTPNRDSSPDSLEKIWERKSKPAWGDHLQGQEKRQKQCCHISRLLVFITWFSFYKVKKTDQPHFWVAQRESDPKHTQLAMLSQQVPNITAVKYPRRYSECVCAKTISTKTKTAKPVVQTQYS